LKDKINNFQIIKKKNFINEYLNFLYYNINIECLIKNIYKFFKIIN
jgi:hypothetical protein